MSKHVLIIDDDEVARNLLHSFFLNKNCDSVEVAFDGRDALNKLKTYKPDVIVLDVMMPVLDGYGLCANSNSSNLSGRSRSLF